MALTLPPPVAPKRIIYKIIVIGDANVGKTSLTYRFCERKCLENPMTTIGVDFRQRVLDIDDEPVTLQIWDTAGLERHRRAMVQHYYRNVNAVIFVFDVTSQQSFDSLKHWIEECDRNTYSDALRILVGNKCDVQMVVNTNEAQKFADKHNMPLFETSAKMDSQCDNVEAIFLTLAHKLKIQRPLIPTDNINLASLTSLTNTPIETKSWCSC